MLNRAMRNAGIKNGFDEIQAEFSTFRDFKLKWTRSYKWISFEVSDYLRNAPKNVMQSLAERGLAEYDPDLVIRWSSVGDGSRKIGRSSILMRTNVMNPALDSEDVPEDALDYALYSQICHVNLGFGPTREDDAERYEAMLSGYLDRTRAETELIHMHLCI